MRPEATRIHELHFVIFLEIAAAASDPAGIAEDDPARIARIDHRCASPLSDFSAKTAVVDGLHAVAAAAGLFLAFVLARIVAHRYMNFAIDVVALENNFTVFHLNVVDGEKRKDPLHPLAVQQAPLSGIGPLQ